MNFCTGVVVHDVITSANDYRLWGFGVAGLRTKGQILGFSVDLRRRRSPSTLTSASVSLQSEQQYTTQFSHKCSKIRIGNRTQAFEWCHFKWPWVTPNLDFKVTTLFNAKTVQKQVTYNGRPIVSCIWSIERRHIQRPWTTLTYDFKVTPLFDAEYLRNDTRFRHIIFNWILIGTYIRPTQQCHFEWP